jgi:5-deoxy-glucuronate isomerase
LIIHPGNSACRVSWIYRLNLKEGKVYSLKNDELELNGMVFNGKARIEHAQGSAELNLRDSFYLPNSDLN